MRESRKFIGISEDGMQYRFLVNGHTSWFTGEGSYCVIIQCKNPKRHKAYETINEDYVFACYSASEAACYFANKVNMLAENLRYANGRNIW